MAKPESAAGWRWAKDEYYSFASALEDRYPNLMKANPMLMGAVVQIRAAEALIDKIMTDAEEALDDDDEIDF